MSSIDATLVAHLSETLTDTQRTILFMLGEEIGMGPGHITARLGISLPDARKALQDMRKKGLCDFGSLHDDDGMLCGSGYWLDRFGVSVRDHVEKHGG